MRINLKREREFLYGSFESELVKALQDFVKPGDVVYDVGAHVGYFTLLFARLVGPKGNCLAFEPSPQVFRRLQSNIQMNKCRLQAKVEGIKVALYDEIGQKKFFLGGCTTTGRLVRFPKEVAEETIVTVPVTTIDSLVGNGMPTPDVIKIDAEYVEDHVIRGAINTISHHYPVILCEVHATDTGVDCFNILRNLSYRIHHIESGQPWDNIDAVSKGHIIAFPENPQV